MKTIKYCIKELLINLKLKWQKKKKNFNNICVESQLKEQDMIQ